MVMLQFDIRPSLRSGIIPDLRFFYIYAIMLAIDAQIILDIYAMGQFF